MNSIYNIKKSKRQALKISFEIKNNQNFWHVKYFEDFLKCSLVWHDFELLIRHLHVFFGLSKMIDRNLDEIYEQVKQHFTLISGEDIIELHYLK